MCGDPRVCWFVFVDCIGELTDKSQTALFALIVLLCSAAPAWAVHEPGQDYVEPFPGVSYVTFYLFGPPGAILGIVLVAIGGIFMAPVELKGLAQRFGATMLCVGLIILATIAVKTAYKDNEPNAVSALEGMTHER